MEENRPEGIRINKYLSGAGVCSRREADREIAAGHVTIDGRKAEIGDRVKAGMRVVFCGRAVEPEGEEILLAFHKPRGVVCTAEKREKNNIVDYINYPKRIYPAGRLDKESEGLILLTNQGELVNKIMRAGNRHEKEYVVWVDHDVTEEFLNRLAGGIYLEELDVTTRRCRVEKKDDRCFVIVLTQGYNRQIRRMCEACGYRVRRLVRTRIMNITLGDLACGTYRRVNGRELRELKELTRDSYSAPKNKESRRISAAREKEKGEENR